MTMPPPTDSQQGDPIAVILARMEVKLDNALTEQAKHSTALDSHDKRLRDLENKSGALATKDDVRAIVTESKPKNVAAWVGVAVALAAVAVAFAALFIH